MTTRTAGERLCPVDAVALDEHTNEHLLLCDEAARTYYDIAESYSSLKVPSRVRLHPSWSWRLPERYRA